MSKQILQSALFLFMGFLLGVIISKFGTLNDQSTQYSHRNIKVHSVQDNLYQNCIRDNTQVIESVLSTKKTKTANEEIVIQGVDSTNNDNLYKSILKSPNRYKESINNTIDVMDDEQALRTIRNMLKLQNETLSSIATPKSYLKNAANILLNEEYNDITLEKGESYVDFSVDVTSSPTSNSLTSAVFTPDSKIIYANFPSTNYSEKNVLVKWTHVGNGEVLLLQSYDINPNADSNHVWLEKENWDVGQYVVEYFSPTTLERISTGTFDVW